MTRASAERERGGEGKGGRCGLGPHAVDGGMGIGGLGVGWMHLRWGNVFDAFFEGFGLRRI